MNAREAVITAFDKHSFDYIDEHDSVHCKCSRVFVSAKALDDHTKYAVASMLSIWQLDRIESLTKVWWEKNAE